MAKDPARARDLMMQVWPAAVARVKEEVADMQAIADTRAAAAPRSSRGTTSITRTRCARRSTTCSRARSNPTSSSDNIVAGALWAAEQRYELTFREITGQRAGLPSRRSRVGSDRHAARARTAACSTSTTSRARGKRSGAWASAYRTQSTFDGRVTAIASNNNNFVKGAAGEPVLISLDDAETLFHEFGHAAHGLLQDVRYPGLAGTPRDFVEYPSQVNEHWLLTREVLDRFARHYQTKEPMPQALVDKIVRSEKFNQGYTTVEYLSSAIVDMDLHTVRDGVVDPDAFERDTLARIGMPREIAMRHRLPQFTHLFASDAYSAGYYSYLWSEVMDADTWKAFLEAGGPWDKIVAKRLRQYILSNGNTIDRAEAYRLFRGRDPEVKALLEQRGFAAVGAQPR